MSIGVLWGGSMVRPATQELIAVIDVDRGLSLFLQLVELRSI